MVAWAHPSMDAGSRLLRIDSRVDAYTSEPGHYGPVLSLRTSGQSAWLHFDGPGSTQQLTDALQAVVGEYVYKAFGEKLLDSGGIGTTLNYIGQWGYQTEIPNWSYVRRRYLFSDVGRWMSEELRSDRFRGLYLYVGNRPTVYVDPNGEAQLIPPTTPVYINDPVPDWDTIQRDAERRRGCAGPCDDSSHHCWAACVTGAGIGLLGHWIPGVLHCPFDIWYDGPIGSLPDLWANKNGVTCAGAAALFTRCGSTGYRALATFCDKCCGSKTCK